MTAPDQARHYIISLQTGERPYMELDRCKGQRPGRLIAGGILSADGG